MDASLGTAGPVACCTSQKVRVRLKLQGLEVDAGP